MCNVLKITEIKSKTKLTIQLYLDFNWKKAMDTIYTTSAVSVGGRDGHVKNADGQIDLDLKTPGSPGDRKGTTPEDLFAAGYSACFNSALNHVMRIKRIKPSGDTTVKIDISLGKDPEGNFRLGARIEGHIPGVEPAQARELMEQAHTVCPYSRATKGNIDAELSIV